MKINHKHRIFLRKAVLCWLGMGWLLTVQAQTYGIRVNPQVAARILCTPPAQPSTIDGNTTVCPNSTGNMYSVTNVAGVTYTWVLPTGWAQTAGGNTNSITVTAGTAGGTIRVTPSYSADCVGPARTLNVSVTDIGSPGANVSTNYRTYNYPGLGRWMIDNSKLGTPLVTTYTGQTAGIRGYYYSLANATTACPSGWGIPSKTEFTGLSDFLKNQCVTTEMRNEWYRYGGTGGGAVSVAVDTQAPHSYQGWDYEVIRWTGDDTFQGAAIGGDGSIGVYVENDHDLIMWAVPVRCIQR